jgi:Tfp pilus assembly protein PilN
MGKERPTGVVFSGEHCRWEAPSRGKEAGASQVIDLRELPAGEGLTREQIRELPMQGGCLVALAGTDVMLRAIQLPTTDADELAGMVELQVDQMSPFGADESTSSYEILSQHEGQSQVLVGICRTAQVEATAGVLRRSGIAVERIESELLSYWYGLESGGHLDAATREVVLLLVESGLYMLIQERGIPLVMALQATPAELLDPELADDLRQTVSHELTGLEVQYGPAVAGHSLVLCGDGAPLAALGEAVGNACGCTPRQLPLASLGSPTALMMARAEQTRIGRPMDLTPLSWLEADRVTSFRSRMWRGALAAVALWAIIVGAGIAALLYQNVRVKQLKARLEVVDAPAGAVMAKRREVGMIKRYTDRAYSVLECLRAISLSQPDGIDLTEMTYRKGVGIDITGEADSSTLRSQFLEALNQVDIFESVSSGATTRTKRQRYRFSIEIRVKGDGREA